MSDYTCMQAPYPNPTQYILAFVEEEIALLGSQRDSLIEQRKATDFVNFTLYQAVSDNLTQNFGEILALSKIKGRLKAMVEIQAIMEAK